jgi:hypothetical protein
MRCEGKIFLGEASRFSEANVDLKRERGRKEGRNVGREMEAELCTVSVVLLLGWACKRCNNKSQPLPIPQVNYLALKHF